MENVQQEIRLTDGADFMREVLDFRRVEMGVKPSVTPDASLVFDTVAQPVFHKNFDLVAGALTDYLEKGYTLYICSDSVKQTDRLKDIFEERGDKVVVTPVE